MAKYSAENLKYFITDTGNRLKYDVLTGGLIRALVFLFVLIVISGIVAIPSVLAYSRVKALVIDELGQNAQNMAVTMSSLIERDAEDFKTLAAVENYQAGTYDKKYYAEMESVFNNIKKQSGVSYLYAEKRIPGSRIAYIFDGENYDDPDFSEIGDTEELQKSEKAVYETGIPYATGIVLDPKWGNYISGFSPIRDPDTGSVLGIVGVDYSLDYLTKIMNNIRNIFVFGIAVIMLLSSVLVYHFVQSSFNTQATDYMTDLRNRYFHELQLRRTVGKAKYRKTALSLMMIDLDDFKRINDTHGHPAGDSVLKAVAQVLKNQTRDTDLCSRYGGDEFVVMLPFTDAAQAAHIADRIRAAIEKTETLAESKQNIPATVSIGVAEWEKGMTAETLTANADKALYTAKGRGGNIVTIYKDSDKSGKED